jgi:hypothetical protein
VPQPEPVPIDEPKVKEWAMLGATDRDIAHRLGISQRHLRRQCRQLLRTARAMRRMRLRTLQWKEAEAGSVQMLILLGKDELGQGQEKPAKDEHVIIRRRAIPPPDHPQLPASRTPDNDPASP